MAEKILNSRIIQKHDTEANWLKATNFKPLAGEVIIYDADQNYSYPRIKIGDGNNFVNDLPFAVVNTEIDSSKGIIVNITCDENMENWTADKRHAELLEAAQQGLPVYGNILGLITPVTAIDDVQAYFFVEIGGLRFEVTIAAMEDADQDVVTGSYGAAGVENGLLVVRVTGHIEDHKYSVNHTTQEIHEASLAGKAVVCAFGNGLYTPASIFANRCVFQSFLPDTDAAKGSLHLGYNDILTIEGDVATWHEVALQPKLHPLTINSTKYDGSEEVELNVLTSTDAMPLSDIDAICGAAIYHEDEVTV